MKIIHLAKSLSLLLLTQVACDTGTKLEGYCGNIGAGECFNVERNKYTSDNTPILEDAYKFGVCSTGEPICNEDNQVTECKNEVLPSKEICDGLDNDCDGKVDEQLQDLPSRFFYRPPAENPCISLFGACENLTVSCVDAKWKCDYEDLITVELPDEVSCDGIDNDCDSLVDEEIFKGEFCFDLPPEDWWKGTNGICRVGSSQCINAEKVCIGQVLPEEETCDYVDNDCDGETDELAPDFSKNYDIVFNIDTSGSMCIHIERVIAANSKFINDFKGRAEYRFAVVNMSRLYTIIDNPVATQLVIVESDFSTLETTLNTLSKMGCRGSGFESSIDSMYYVGDVDKNTLNLSWRPNAEKWIFTFTDEEAQSYEDPELIYSDVINVSSKTKHFTWTIYPFPFLSISTQTNGKWFYLNQTEEEIYQNERSLVAELCPL